MWAEGRFPRPRGAAGEPGGTGGFPRTQGCPGAGDSTGLRVAPAGGLRNTPQNLPLPQSCRGGFPPPDPEHISPLSPHPPRQGRTRGEEGTPRGHLGHGG